VRPMEISAEMELAQILKDLLSVLATKGIRQGQCKFAKTSTNVRNLVPGTNAPSDVIMYQDHSDAFAHMDTHLHQMEDIVKVRYFFPKSTL